MLYENYACGGVGNYNGYSNSEIDKLIEQQSMEADQEKRKHIVWEIERRLTEDDAKPLVYFNRGGICWDPKVKGLTVMSTASTRLAYGGCLVGQIGSDGLGRSVAASSPPQASPITGAWKTSGSTSSARTSFPSLGQCLARSRCVSLRTLELCRRAQ
jgi:hypothetical protein